MRAVVLLLLALILTAPCFAISYGQSLVRVERVWTVQGTGSYAFDGGLVANDSNQRVMSITTVPDMEVVSDSLGNIRVRYNGTAETLTAIATVAVDFDTNITSDPALERRALNATNLTMWDDAIAAEAEARKANDSLETVLNLANFVNTYINYNTSYFGAVRPAVNVYRERQGVCVEYTHLLISMSRYLGFDTRYVGGYVNGGSWQPHAWAEIEVPGYGWLPADATFGEIGTLDNSHVSNWKGEDQNSVVDRVESIGPVNFSVSDSYEFLSTTTDEKGHAVSYQLDADSGILNISLSNQRSDYRFGKYSLLMPEDLMVNDSRVVLLKPDETLVIPYQLDILALKPGYMYSIPIIISFDDAALDDTLNMTFPEKYQPVNGNQDECSTAAGFLLLLLLTNLFLSRK